MASTTTTPVKPPLPVPHHTTTTPGLVESIKHVAGQGLSLTTIGGIIAGVLILIAVVSLVALVVIRRRGGSHKYPATKMLDRSLEVGDAVGFIMDLDTHKLNIVPLRRVQGYYISLEPKYSAIVTANPYAHTFMLHGKPVIHAVGSGRSALQVDPVVFTKLGLAQVALKDPLWHSTTEPRKTFELLVEHIMGSMGRQIGELPLTHNVKLSFEMAPPDVLLSLLQQYVVMNEQVINSTVNFSETSEQLAKILREHKLKELEVKQKWLWIVVGAVTMITFVAAIAWYIIHLHGP